MPTGSGLDGQLGLAPETTWGTAVTVDRFVEFNSESLSLEPTWLEPTGIRAGLKHKRVSRVRQSRKTVSGDVTVEHATKGMGILWKHALGSPVTAPVQIGTTTAYEQNHTPGDFLGLGLTVQVGRPEPSTGTVQPFTFAGCKCASWQFSLQDGEIPTLQLSVDGRSENTATALAAAAYDAGASIFDFSQATLLVNGVAAANVINQVTLSGESPMATERFGVGNAGLKNEPLENDTPTITGELAAEFLKADYDRFVNNDTVSLQLTLTGEVIGTTAENFTLDFTLPACKFKNASPTVEGPDIVAMSTEIEAYSNEVDPVITVRIVSDETAL